MVFIINAVVVVVDVVVVDIVVVTVIVVVIYKTQYGLFQLIPLTEHRCFWTEKDGDDGGDE